LFLEYLYYLDPEEPFKQHSTFDQSNTSFSLRYCKQGDNSKINNSTDYRHTRQDRFIQTEQVSTLAKNATKPNAFEMILIQTTRKEDNWKTEATLERGVVTLKTERI
jgi:hypothetical protein